MQLTLYAPSFPAFRFYVNFNSVRRTSELERVYSLAAANSCALTQPTHWVPKLKFIRDYRIEIDEIPFGAVWVVIRLKRFLESVILNSILPQTLNGSTS